VTTETKVGAFVVAALVLLAATIYGVHATRTVRGQVRFKTYLRDAGGLDADTGVLFGGIRVGRVTAVRPDTDDPTRIEIAFEVKAGTPVNGQSKAQVGTVSLMGTPSLLITTGSNEAPRLAPGAVVPSQESVSTSELARRVGTVVDNANNVLLDLHREIPEVAAQLHSVLDNVNTLTGAENQQQIRTVLAGVRTLVNDTDAVIVSAKPLMANIDQTVRNVSRTFDSVRGTVDSLREPLVDDLKALHDTLEDARGAIGSVQGVVRTNEDDFAETMRALRTASENLRTMTEQLKARPWNLIRTTQSNDRKVPR
jgi:phospholipid/cholesterol/gamma-HCH transport system substrate-binding protein